MKRGGVLLGILFLPAVAAGGPRLHLDEDHWDLGKVRQGAEAVHIFQIRNVGDEALNIKAARSSCPECMVVEGVGKTLAAGKWDTLKVLYLARSRPGHYAPYVEIHTDDPVEPVKRIALNVAIMAAQGAAEMKCSPERFDLGVLRKGGSRTLEVVVANSKNAKKVLTISRVYSGTGLAVKTPLPVEIRPGKSEVLTFEVAATAPGILSLHASIASNDPVRPIVSVPATGYVLDEAREGTAVKGTAKTDQGLTIRPVGDTVAVPGTGGVLSRRLLIRNGTAGVVRVRFPESEKSPARVVPAAVTVEPGAETVVELRPRPDRVGRNRTLPISIDYPAIVEPDRGSDRDRRTETLRAPGTRD